jgi:hypothetical protein
MVASHNRKHSSFAKRILRSSVSASHIISRRLTECSTLGPKVQMAEEGLIAGDGWISDDSSFYGTLNDYSY